MDDMTPTDKLRALLDERGVEWHDTKIGRGYITIYVANGITWTVTEHSSGSLTIRGSAGEHITEGITPEQAIAATVGDGEGSRDEWRSVALGLFDHLEKADLEVAQRWLCENDLLRQEIAYGNAKAATVGSTCQAVLDPTYYKGIHGYCQSLKCSKCGEPLFKEFRSCPWCGSKVVSA